MVYGMSALTDTRVRTAKPLEKAYKLSDGGQLYLFVMPSGTKSWRMNYQFGRNAAGNPLADVQPQMPRPHSYRESRRDWIQSLTSASIQRAQRTPRLSGLGKF